jgi:hypothetical protein
MLKVKIVSTSVRTAGWWTTKRKPSATSLATGRGDGCSFLAGGLTRVTSTAPSATSTAWPTKGNDLATANSAAPMAGPTSWYTVTKPVCSRALATVRSPRSTSEGNSELEAVLLKTSAVPRRNIARRTSVMSTLPVRIEAASNPSTAARARSTVATIRARLRRSASAPASRAKTSQGRRWSRVASATKLGSRVTEAMSSGPAASAKPSPRLDTQEDATSQRKLVPSRRGSRLSRSRFTLRRERPNGAAPARARC